MKDQSKFLIIAKGLFFLIAAIVLIPVALGLFANFGKGGWYKNIQAEIVNQPYARTITVSGEGKVTAIPNIAKITLSVSSTGQTVAEVTKNGNTKMNAVVDQLKQLGIDAKDIKTSQYNLYPQYNNIPVIYPTNTSSRKRSKIIGYRLVQSTNVKIRNLKIVDKVLSKSIQAGANQVGALVFDIDDNSKYKDDARKLAFAAAKSKAEDMASAAGVGLGRVITFNENSIPVYAPMAYSVGVERAKTTALPAPSIQPGSQELKVTVNVTYEIE